MKLNILKYELKKIASSSVFKFFTLIYIFVTWKSTINLQTTHHQRNFNVLEGVIYTLNDKNIITWILVPISLYIMIKIFYDDEIDYQVKVKSKSRVNWFSQKLIAIIVYIAIIVILLIVISLCINFIMLNLDFGWSHFSFPEVSQEHLYQFDISIFPFQPYYQPLKVIILTSIFLILGIWILGLIVSLISLITNKPIIGVTIGFIYYIFSIKYINFLEIKYSFIKYFSIDSYILFSNHNFNGMDTNLFTVRESFLGLIILSIALFLIGIIVIKKKDF